MKYRVIADEYTVNGFSMLGVEGTAVDCSAMLRSKGENAQADAQTQAQAQAREAFECAISDSTLGALIISAPVAAMIQPEIIKHKQSGKFPQIIGMGEDVC